MRQEFDTLQPKSRGSVAVTDVGPSNKGLLAYADGVGWNPGSEGYWFWDGAMWTPAAQLMSGQAVLASSFTLNAANGTYQDTGLAVNLPVKGTYKIYGSATGNLNFSVAGSGFITVKLYNSTDAADVANSERLVVFFTTINTAIMATAPLGLTIPVNAAKTIKLYAKRDGTTTAWNTSAVESGPDGRTVLGYMRIG